MNTAHAIFLSLLLSAEELPEPPEHTLPAEMVEGLFLIYYLQDLHKKDEKRYFLVAQRLTGGTTREEALYQMIEIYEKIYRYAYKIPEEDSPSSKNILKAATEEWTKDIYAQTGEFIMENLYYIEETNDK